MRDGDRLCLIGFPTLALPRSGERVKESLFFISAGFPGTPSTNFIVADYTMISFYFQALILKDIRNDNSIHQSSPTQYALLYECYICLGY